jgi:hypothetical protein
MPSSYNNTWLRTNLLCLSYLQYIVYIAYPLALPALPMALKGAGSYLLILGFILPQVYRNSSSYYCCESFVVAI